MTIEMTVCYDNAVQTDEAGGLIGLGQPVSRTAGTLAV